MRGNMMFENNNCASSNDGNSLLMIISILFLLFATFLFFISDNLLLVAAEPVEDEYELQEDLLDRGDIAEIFEFGTGIFAAILFVLSLIAYRTSRSNRLIFVACAFGLFAIRTIVLRLDLFIPEIESSIL